MANPDINSDNIRDLLSFNFFTERGLVSGFYLAALAFGLMLSNPQLGVNKDNGLLVFGVCFVLSIIMSHITYELLLTVSRWFTDPIVMRGFYECVAVELKNIRTKIPSYAELRKFREAFLASDGNEQYKSRIRNDERLRQILTYLYTTSILGLLVIWQASILPGSSAPLIRIELLIVGYVFASTVLGQIARSLSFGRSIGIAYLKGQKTI